MKSRDMRIGIAAVLAVVAANVLAADDGMVWGLMLQLGHNMWRQEPIWGEDAEDKADIYNKPYNRTKDDIWHEVTEYAAKKGVNLLLIDIGEAYRYPSHPELAVPGAWSPDKMRAELKRLRELGIEPIPKLNFSANHDEWLQGYARKVSTPEYYRVCADLIRDVCEVFDRPRLFHLGMDEERAAAQKSSYRSIVERQGELWWHDFLYLVGEVEKNGSKAWIWSDYNWVHHPQFVERMPHSVMQSNWHYTSLAHMVRNDFEIARRDFPEKWAGPLGFLELEAAKFDQIPCASTCNDTNNLEVVVKFCKEHVAKERIKGFLMAPWLRTYREKDRTGNKAACDLIEKARRIWESDVRDVVIYSDGRRGVEAAIEERKKGREPIVIGPGPGDPDTAFWERDWALVVNRGETLVDATKGKDGIWSVRTSSGKTYRAKRFVDRSKDEVGPSKFPIPPNWKTFLTREKALTKGDGHVQGMCVSHEAIYMSQQSRIFKFDWRGNLLTSVPVDKHTGDICLWKGRIYSAVCLPGKQPDGCRGRIEVFDAEDLSFIRRTKFERSADGITCVNGTIYIGLGPVLDKAKPFRGNYFGKFDAETLEPRCEPFIVDHGYDVSAGVQDIATDGERLYINFYTPEEGTPCFFVFDLDFNVLGAHVFGWRNGHDVVGGGKDGAVRFVWLETVGWMRKDAYPQALVNYAELKDGKISDLSQHIIFRKPKER